jgi:hypothetical protein
MKNIKFILPLLALTLFSCSDYLDINTTPNNLFFEQATPAKLLPGAQVTTYRVQATTMNTLGNVFMNSWTRNVQSYGNGYDNELQLVISNSFYSGIWDGLYLNLKNFDAIIKYPNPDGKYDNYVAAAKICKAFYMQRIVDLYGKCPYSEAWKGLANTTPKYDDDFAIYKDLVANLEQARALIANPSPNAEDISSVDVMLRGDMAKWNEFANSTELRLLLRMSEATDATVIAFRDLKLQDIKNNTFLSGNVIINPGYSGATDEQATPGFNVYAVAAAGTNQANRLFITMSGHAYKALQSTATTNWPVGATREIIAGSGVTYPDVTDPRSARLFTVGSGQTFRRAVTQGATLVDVTTPTGSLPGLPCRLGLIGNFNPYAQAPNQTLAEYFACNGSVMSFSESKFLEAEAAVRYPAVFTGSAQTAFNAAVTDDFIRKVATIGTYLTVINAKPNFGFSPAFTTAQKLHAIMFQKWIALMGVNAIESYIDYTRTGYPLTPLSTVTTQTRKPYRLIYPVTEYVANSSNVPNMVSADAFTINAFTPFWKR